MAHLLHHEPWGVVDLDTSKRRVFVREDWQYSWDVEPGQPDWTHAEQLAFHKAVDRAVWAKWSERVRIQARSSGFQKHPTTDRFKWEIAGVALELSFDVRMVRSNGHWRVTVNKVDPQVKPKPRAEVINKSLEIILYSTDLLVTTARRSLDDPPNPGFSVHAHEFGHTMGPAGLVDEYKPESAQYYDDRESIMNVGRQLRARHLVHVCNALGALVPGCSFIPLVTP